MTHGLCSQRLALALCGLLLVCRTAAAAEFSLYPGAKTDAWAAEASKHAKLPPGTESELYVTQDAYEKVYAFYKKSAREFSMGSGGGPTLPNGTQVMWSFFLLDDAKGLADSKLWLKVQRPSIADMEMKDVRDITSIQVVRKK